MPKHQQDNSDNTSNNEEVIMLSRYPFYINGANQLSLMSESTMGVKIPKLAVEASTVRQGSTLIQNHPILKRMLLEPMNNLIPSEARSTIDLDRTIEWTQRTVIASLKASGAEVSDEWQCNCC